MNVMDGNDELSVRRMKREISNLLLSLFVEFSSDRLYWKVLDTCNVKGCRHELVMDVIGDAHRASEKHWDAA
jgi:hypothetical protein